MDKEMNANELADELEKRHLLGGYASEAATMLRQQQAEIEALKAAKIRAYDNGVEDGRKPDTNNEPVAWAVWEGRPHDLFFTKEDADELCRLKGGDAKSVPLYTHQVSQYKAITNTKIEPTVVSYTHPVKELTDEEIDNLIMDVAEKPTDEDLYDFARAILKRASEK